MRSITAQRFWPLAASALLIVCVIGWLGAQIPKGFLTNTDELFTSERSREMLLTDRWAVRENFEISAVKPPLQYWLTTLTLSRFEDRELAVRIWSLIYGMLTAIALGWLAYVLDPKRPWLIPLSIALLLSCPLFLTETTRALLDTGLTFFTTLAIVFAQLARRQPIWWIAVAVTCWLGSLQKIPLILLVWLIIILVRLGSRSERATLRSGWLVASLIVAAACLAIWPLLQMSMHRIALSEVFRWEETAGLVGPTRLGARQYFEIPFRLCTTWPCGLFALLSPVALHFVGKGEESRTPVREISILSLTVIGLALAFNFRSVRYVLPIIPCLCLLLAFFLHWLLEKRQAAYRLLFALVFILAMSGWEITRRMIDHRRKDASDQKRLAEELGALQQKETQIVILEPDKSVLPEHFFLFYGNLRFSVTKYTIAEMHRVPVTRPAIGVSAARDFAVIQEKYRDVTIRLARGQFICWRAPALE